ncbi:hypothetical protein [Ornithinimicrobium avium]|uniref:Uncharacterized protein n=1 Tax=Ornithinimicrobium avium TaxID=2283195 RepID=A0A345NPP4_9MICO|nr:hypothetical protein [Ornithinimicrobium avium]AXH97002.1 hypothetical protein DV701_13525 [Ornithinimicrobium avium]
MSLLSGRWLGGLGTSAFVLAALAVGRVVGDQLPDPFEPLSAPREHAVGVGETAYLREAELTVTGTRLGPLLDDGLSPVPTPGIWLVVDLELTGAGSDSQLRTWEVVAADGTSWAQTRGLTRTCSLVPPGITQRCSVALEVLPAALPGATLRLGTASDLRYDDVAVVELGLTAADVEAAASDAPVATLPLELVGADGQGAP